MEKIFKKTYKILVLSFVILIVALVFFFWRGKQVLNQINKPANETENQFALTPLSPGFTPAYSSIVSDSSKPEMPSPDKFKTFIYPEIQNLEISIKCIDDYYAVLIFNSADDYRNKPNTAKFNKAFECQNKEEFVYRLNLEQLNLPTGKYYYFVADEGKEEDWYNPR